MVCVRGQATTYEQGARSHDLSIVFTILSPLSCTKPETYHVLKKYLVKERKLRPLILSVPPDLPTYHLAKGLPHLEQADVEWLVAPFKVLDNYFAYASGQGVHLPVFL